MKVRDAVLPEIKIIEPEVFGDERGFFVETWRAERYAESGLPPTFVQDNLSRSRRGILRGLHLQQPNPQGKLVTVIEGEIYDVAVDVRVGSPTFGRFVGETLLGEARRQMYIPPGFAHGFCVVSEHALVAYKCTAPYSPATEIGVLWNDPDLAIEWPVRDVAVSPRDAKFSRLRDIPESRLPRF